MKLDPKPSEGNPIYINKECLASLWPETPVQLTPLPGAGGSRRYWRADFPSGPLTLTLGHDPAENRAFCQLAAVMAAQDANVPRVVASDLDRGIYLQTWLGNRDLASQLGSPERLQLVKQALSRLVDLQTMAPEKWRSLTMGVPFCPARVMWDLNYFKYELVKPLDIPFDEWGLQQEFDRIAERMGKEQPGWGFMHRDFQSRNVMLHNGDCWIIDFQGGMYGPALYDAVSMLWQAKAGFTAGERRECLEHYAREYCGRVAGMSPERLLEPLEGLVALRVMQTLGAYGLRGLVERKAHFLQSLPLALPNAAQVSRSRFMEQYPILKGVLEAVTAHPRLQSEPPHEGLRVEVISFSYKKGYPDNFTGNGGGFMFDCRGMANPGRYEQYKPLTGLDRPVRDFLEDKGEVQPFVERALELVLPTVRNYLERGFSSLQVGFGCTGGRHRSVYCADGFARALRHRLAQEVGLQVVVNHREHGIREEVKG